MSEKKILNCPLCGGEVFIYYSGSQFQFGEVVCKECGCCSGRKKVDETIELWNTRKPMERIVEQLDRMKSKPIELCYDVLLIDSIIEIVKEEGEING